MNFASSPRGLELLSLDQAAQILGVSPKTVRSYIRRRGLRCVRYSRTSALRFREADLRTWLESRRDTSTPPA